MIVVGDIGGTKTNLALFEENGDSLQYSDFATYPSKDYANLQSIVKDFLKKTSALLITTACFALAGPIKDGVCVTTNLPWRVDATTMSAALGIDKVFLLNDLEANAYAIEILPETSFLTLFPGKTRAIRNRAVISPGTGLGESNLVWDGIKYQPLASEGGHCEFGPRNDLEIDLCRYIYQRYGHASYERVLSGPGLHNIYGFFKEVLHREEPDWLQEEMQASDPAKVITKNALNGKSALCNDALNLFVSILGSEAGNCVLKFLALGGIYLGGGIPPKILPKLQDPIFFDSFIDKGRFKELLQEVPIRIILDDRAAMKGAARYCQIHM